MSIGFDVDETIADLHSRWIQWGNQKFGTEYTEFTCWDSPEIWWGKAAFNFICPAIYDHNIVQPFSNARNTIERLRARGHYIGYVTSCLGGTEEAKEQWLRRWGFLRWNEGLTTGHFMPTHDKSLAPVDVLVDDGLHNVEAFKGRGILINKPHNQSGSWGDYIDSLTDLLTIL